MAGKMKKIAVPIDIKKTYLERDGQRIELGKINVETLTSVEEEALNKIPASNLSLSPTLGSLSCETTITLKTFIGLLDGVYVRLRDAIIPIAAKDLVWGNNDEAACYVWKETDESSVLTWHNYMKDWAFTVEGFGEKMSEINLDTNKSLKEIFQTIPIIYSRLYTNADGTSAENNTIIEIETGNLSWSKDEETAYYIWGWPGPDYNIYSRGYYKTDWAFTKQEMEKIVNQ